MSPYTTHAALLVVQSCRSETTVTIIVPLVLVFLLRVVPSGYRVVLPCTFLTRRLVLAVLQEGL